MTAVTSVCEANHKGKKLELSSQGNSEGKKSKRIKRKKKKKTNEGLA